MPNLDGRGPIGRGQGGCRRNARSFGCNRMSGQGLCVADQGDSSVVEAQIKAHQAKIDFLQNRLDELKVQDS